MAQPIGENGSGAVRQHDRIVGHHPKGWKPTKHPVGIHFCRARDRMRRCGFRNDVTFPPFRQFPPQRIIGRDDRPPVEHVMCPLSPGRTHAFPERRVIGQTANRFRRYIDVHGNRLADAGKKFAINIFTREITAGRLQTGTGVWSGSRDQDPILAVTYRIAIAVPIAAHRRQTRGHRFNRRQTETLLNVIDQRDEDIRARPERIREIWGVILDKTDRGFFANNRRRFLLVLTESITCKISIEDEMETPRQASGLSPRSNTLCR